MTSGLFGMFFSFGYLLSCFFFFHTFKHDIWDYIFALKKQKTKKTNHDNTLNILHAVKEI